MYRSWRREGEKKTKEGTYRKMRMEETNPMNVAVKLRV